MVDSKKTKTITLFAIGVICVAVLLYLFNPAEHSYFIPCPFHYVTGYHCPGCGSQRAVHQLLHGNLIGAFRLNPLMVITLPLLIYALGQKGYNFIFDTQHRVGLFYSKFFIYGYFGIALLFWVLRNIPHDPFTWLAPLE
ncbi:MAG: DUF2752 domain-containing protein [Flavobacteriaceae bacterium]|nr:DUF2752 domain-containing protein [Flavobacteriaceae bacterium]